MKKELESDGKITFTFNPRTEKTDVILAPSYYIMLYGRLSKILGYGGIHIKIRKSTESSYVVDLFGITSIFVYCDVVQPQSTPILKTVPVSQKSGKLITRTFTNILYVPVHKKSFEDIEILLRSDTGDAVPFEGDSNTLLQEPELLRLNMIPLRACYEMPVFRGACWQKGYGKMGYGLGAFFGGLARSALPMLFKGGLKAAKMATITMVKRSIKSAGKSAIPIIKRKAKPMINKGAKSLGKYALRKCIGMLSDFLAQKVFDTTGIRRTGQGSRLKSRRRQTKRPKTSPVDIFG